MADRPILFSGPMVRALIADRKTQTRRIIKPQPTVHANGAWAWEGKHGGFVGAMGTHIDEGFPRTATDWMPIQPGDHLWVKENHAIVPRTAYRMSEGVQQTLRHDDDHDAAVYAAEWERSKPGRWRASIHMPRWASRLTLIVTGVKVERLGSISDEDAIAEGILPDPDRPGWWMASTAETDRCPTPRDAYLDLWNSINGDGASRLDPWVVAYTFTVERRNIDAPANVAKDISYD